MIYFIQIRSMSQMEQRKWWTHTLMYLSISPALFGWVLIQYFSFLMVSASTYNAPTGLGLDFCLSMTWRGFWAMKFGKYSTSGTLLKLASVKTRTARSSQSKRAAAALMLGKDHLTFKMRQQNSIQLWWRPQNVNSHCKKMFNFFVVFEQWNERKLQWYGEIPNWIFNI